MRSMLNIAGTIFFIASLLLPGGCAVSPDADCRRETRKYWPDFLVPAADKVEVYFFRNANYAGSGRIHILKIDNHEIGELTADNYYRLELWPGQYHFSVFLPPENFFGQESPPLTLGEEVLFRPSDSGSTYGYTYTDGMGTGGFQLKRFDALPEVLSHRTLSGKLSVRDTAQVTALFDARYDGPAIKGRPHGLGTLVFPDGNRYRGVFEHGLPTNRARFFFNDGTLFMGLFQRGRPKNQGVLIASCGQILFAGRFVNEKPNGVGLRSGTEGPEFCVYDHGRDMTQSFRQLAREILDLEDQAQVDALTRPIGQTLIPSDADQERSAQVQAADDSSRANSDNQEQSPAGSAGAGQAPNGSRKTMLLRASKTEQHKLTKELSRTRFERELKKVKELKADHQAKIEEKRIWCMDEFALGRELCSCAPFKADIKDWPECVESFER